MFQLREAVVMLHYVYGAFKKSVEAYVTHIDGYVMEVPFYLFRLILLMR